MFGFMLCVSSNIQTWIGRSNRDVWAEFTRSLSAQFLQSSVHCNGGLWLESQPQSRNFEYPATQKELVMSYLSTTVQKDLEGSFTYSRLDIAEA
jgi:hypothetical protein